MSRRQTVDRRTCRPPSVVCRQAMTKMYLIRHAETERTHDDPTLWPLSERGEEQVKLLAAQPFWSEVKAIITSDEPKAIATVKDVAFERGIALFTRDCLRELKRTHEWIDDYDERVRDVFAQPAVSRGGWERATDAQARILSCVEALMQQYDPQAFGVVSHGMVLALLLASLNNMHGHTFELWQQLGFASVTLMERQSE